jgi:hypothetical protein
MDTTEQIKNLFAMLETYASRRIENRNRYELSKGTQKEMADRMQERLRITREWYLEDRRQRNEDLKKRQAEGDARIGASERKTEATRNALRTAHRARAGALVDLLAAVERKTNG